MVFPIDWKDVKEMSIDELIKERKSLCKWMAETEHRLFGPKDHGIFWVQMEDDDILYSWWVERIEEILQEIKRRMSDHKWIFY